jgi:hypothetical protein
MQNNKYLGFQVKSLYKIISHKFFNNIINDINESNIKLKDMTQKISFSFSTKISSIQ